MSLFGWDFFSFCHEWNSACLPDTRHKAMQKYDWLLTSMTYYCTFSPKTTNIYDHIWMHQQKSTQFMFVCPFNCTLANIYKLARPESMQSSIHPVANVQISSHVLVWNLMSESAPRAFCLQQTTPKNFSGVNASPSFLDLIFLAAVRISSVARSVSTPVRMRVVSLC